MANILRPLLVALALTGSSSLVLAAGPTRPEQPAHSSALSASTPFRHVIANGTTKPPGAALDDRRGSSMALVAIDMRLDRLVRTAICTGC